jgi:hypothetical protein
MYNFITHEILCCITIAHSTPFYILFLFLSYYFLQAKEAGSTRFCMGAAWRETIGRKSNFNQILEYVKEIRYSLESFVYMVKVWYMTLDLHNHAQLSVTYDVQVIDLTALITWNMKIYPASKSFMHDSYILFHHFSMDN